MRSVSIVAMKPGSKPVESLHGYLIGGRIGSFSEGDLYEAFDLAIGSQSVGSGTDMADIEIGTETAEDLGSAVRIRCQS